MVDCSGAYAHSVCTIWPYVRLDLYLRNHFTPLFIKRRNLPRRSNCRSSQLNVSLDCGNVNHKAIGQGDIRNRLFRLVPDLGRNSLPLEVI